MTNVVPRLPHDRSLAVFAHSLLQRRVLTAAAMLLLALPIVLAFFSGGYGDVARLWAGIATWTLLAFVLLAGDRRFPTASGGRLAIGGLAGLTLLTGLSVTWAPLAGPAFADFQRLLLYLPYLLVTALVLAPAARRHVEPALLAGIVLVCAYGLAGRYAPSIVPMTISRAAGGRLDQPLTYWNAIGIVSAMGWVLSAHVLGSAERRDRTRLLAAGAAVLLGAAAALTLSRGTYMAVAVGGLALIAMVGDRRQTHACVTALLAALAGAAAVLPLPAVRTLAASDADRRIQGLIALAITVAVIAATLTLTRRWLLGTGASARAAVPLSRRTRRAVLAAIAAVAVGGFIAVAFTGDAHRASSKGSFGAQPGRLASTESNRSSYWDVALRTFGEHPVEGIGTGGFRVAWLRHRPFPESAKDAHSLYVETAAELGSFGLVALAALFVGAVVATIRAVRADRAMAGPAALLAAYALHAGLDWDWEMPTVTLLALASLGLLIGASTGTTDNRSATTTL